MSTTVAAYPITTFTSPTNGTSPIDADEVKTNDNTIRTAHNAHDADPGIHFQSSLLAARPAAGSAGRKWLTTDSDTPRIWYDNGSSWFEASYLSASGGTVAGATTFSSLITFSSGIAVTGASTITGTLGGVTTLTATTVAATNLGGTLSTAAQPNVTSLGTLTGLAVSGSTAISVATSNVNGITLSAAGGSTARTRVLASGTCGFTVERSGTSVFQSFTTNAGEEVFFGADNAATFYINDAANTTTPWLTVSNTQCTLPAATTSRASITLPHGTAPSSPTNGDMWTTTAGLFVRINGVTRTVTVT